MSRATRRENSEARLRSLEERFSNDLIVALRECASGTWGLFGQNETALASLGKYTRENLKSGAAQGLPSLGEEIEALRRELGYPESFALFSRYLSYREMRSANSVGEPRLAMEFLNELGATGER